MSLAQTVLLLAGTHPYSAKHKETGQTVFNLSVKWRLNGPLGLCE